MLTHDQLFSAKTGPGQRALAAGASTALTTHVAETALTAAEATALDGVAHELRAGRGELVARDAAQRGAQQRLLERAAVVIE